MEMGIDKRWPGTRVRVCVCARTRAHVPVCTILFLSANLGNSANSGNSVFGLFPMLYLHVTP